MLAVGVTSLSAFAILCRTLATSLQATTSAPAVSVSRQDDRKLIPPETSREVRASQGFPKNLGNGPQRLISCGVPVGVVDHLGVVQIKHQHSPAGSVTLSVVKLPDEFLLESTPVVEPRQRVVLRQSTEFLF